MERNLTPSPALQMWTLRDMMREDFSTTAQSIADIGYRSVELAGSGNTALGSPKCI